MPLLLFFLLISLPNFARIFVDYTIQLPKEKKDSHFIIIQPCMGKHAEALGYSAKEIFILSPSIQDNINPKDLKETVLRLTEKNRYGIVFDIKNTPPLKHYLNKNLNSITKNFALLENPIANWRKTTEDEKMIAHVFTNILLQEDVFLSPSLLNNRYPALLINIASRPKQKSTIVPIENGFLVFLPDAFFAYNKGSLRVVSIPSSLFKRYQKNPLKSKSVFGSMPLWKESSEYKLLIMPQSSSLWRTP